MSNPMSPLFSARRPKAVPAPFTSSAAIALTGLLLIAPSAGTPARAQPVAPASTAPAAWAAPAARNGHASHQAPNTHAAHTAHAAHAAHPARAADPLDARAAVPPATHKSSLAAYRRYADQPVGSWREINETVNRVGGWRAYAREAQGDAAQPAAPPPPGASAPVGQSQQSGTPGRGGHGNHGDHGAPRKP
ncbi:MAG: hypothetical protein JNL30_00415 [Rubrivivax sp.]|nr:hypothetical protein [Rubrivivax sp.]